MQITSPDDVAGLIALRCAPARVAEVRDKVAKAGILLRGHFQLQSGAHSEYFLRVRGLAGTEDMVDDFARELLEIASAEQMESAILCPESAGFLLGEAIARLVDIPVVVVKTDMARRPSSELRWGQLDPGSDVLLVNDVITSGTSIGRLQSAAYAHRAGARRVVALATLGTSPLKALNDLKLQGLWLIECLWPLYSPDQCELCTRQIPLILSAELG